MASGLYLDGMNRLLSIILVIAVLLAPLVAVINGASASTHNQKIEAAAEVLAHTDQTHCPTAPSKEDTCPSHCLDGKLPAVAAAANLTQRVKPLTFSNEDSSRLPIRFSDGRASNERCKPPDWTEPREGASLSVYALTNRYRI